VRARFSRSLRRASLLSVGEGILSVG